MSNGGKLNIALETDWDVKAVEALAEGKKADRAKADLQQAKRSALDWR